MKTPLALFLAHCSLVATLRDVTQLWRGKPVVVGLVVPREADTFAYEEALPYLVDRKVSGNPFADMGYDSQLAVLELGKNKARSRSGENIQFLRLYDRVVTVVSDEEQFPQEFVLAADSIKTAVPITAEYIRGAVKKCLGIEISLDQASEFTDVPLDHIDLMLRKGRSIDIALQRLNSTRQPSSSSISDEISPQLKDLHGLGEASEWGHELANDLRDWKTGKIGWRDIDRGVLLSGPPGTGKTMFAAALARTCDAPLIAASIARWQSKGHLGEMLAAMRKSFAEALAQKPSILFLDEIDAVGDRRAFSGHNAQYSREVVAALLECMDGIEKRDGVVIVGACNNPALIDPALTRAGRLDRHIALTLPDARAREGILRWHLSGSLPDTDLGRVAQRTEGWTGADIEQLVRRARRVARRLRRDISIVDLTAALPEMKPLSPALRQRYAVHESGHVVVALELGFVDVKSVSIASAVIASIASQSAGVTNYAAWEDSQNTRDHFLAFVCRSLAGLAAEEALLGVRSTAAGGVTNSDLHRATIAAAQLEASYGMGSCLGFVSSHDDAEILSIFRTNRDVRLRTEALLTQQYGIAKGIVETRRADVEKLAAALIEHGALDALQIATILGKTQLGSVRDAALPAVCPPTTNY